MKTIQVSEAYVRLVLDLLDLQQKYFAKSAEAKRTKNGITFQEAKDILRECKQTESDLRLASNAILAGVNGSMTADQAIAALREQLDLDLHAAASDPALRSRHCEGGTTEAISKKKGVSHG